MGYRVGVDVGGTFTDLICVTPDGDVVLDKPSTLDDQRRRDGGLQELPTGRSLSPRSAEIDISCTAPPLLTTR
jgi:N-methylhydantoinase A/oxoprolinase/acetone carboxylase beta subunit